MAVSSSTNAGLPPHPYRPKVSRVCGPIHARAPAYTRASCSGTNPAAIHGSEPRCARSIVSSKREPRLRASVCERCCPPCHCRRKTFHLNRLRRRTRRLPPKCRRRRNPLRRFLRTGRHCRQIHRQSPLSPRGCGHPSAARGCHPALNSPTDHVTQATPPGFPSRAPDINPAMRLPQRIG
jgi:hypothetical protein